jgi:hypothetical protein
LLVVQRVIDLAVRGGSLAVQAPGVDLEQDVNGVPGTLRDLSGRYARSKPGGHRSVPQVVRVGTQR